MGHYVIFYLPWLSSGSVWVCLLPNLKVCFAPTPFYFEEYRNIRQKLQHVTTSFVSKVMKDNSEERNLKESEKHLSSYLKQSMNTYSEEACLLVLSDHLPFYM